MIQTLTTQAAPVVAAAAIDLDGTVLIQFVIFAFVLLFLHFVLFRPYLKAVDAREEGVGGAREEAAEMEARASNMIDEYEQKMRQARRDAQDVRESLRNQGLQEQTDMVEDVRDEIGDTLAEEREQIREQVESAKADIKSRSEQLASAMVDKILPAA
ncbi:MAG: ATP synthase F0 subunit B [Myxococcota bacterium]